MNLSWLNIYLIWLKDVIFFKAIILRTPLSVDAIVMLTIQLVTPGNTGLLKWSDDIDNDSAKGKGHRKMFLQSQQGPVFDTQK
jgi:hypothetical protein